MKWKWDSDLGFQASKTFSIILSAAASGSFQISKASFYSKFNELWAELGEKGRDFGPKATIDIVWESNFHLISYFVSSWVWRNVRHQVGPKRLNRIQNWVIKHTKLTQVDYFPPHSSSLSTIYLITFHLIESNWKMSDILWVDRTGIKKHRELARRRNESELAPHFHFFNLMFSSHPWNFNVIVWHVMKGRRRVGFFRFCCGWNKFFSEDFQSSLREEATVFVKEGSMSPPPWLEWSRDSYKKPTQRLLTCWNTGVVEKLNFWEIWIRQFFRLRALCSAWECSQIAGLTRRRHDEQMLNLNSLWNRHQASMFTTICMLSVCAVCDAAGYFLLFIHIIFNSTSTQQHLRAPESKFRERCGWKSGKIKCQIVNQALDSARNNWCYWPVAAWTDGLVGVGCGVLFVWSSIDFG